MTYKTVLAPNAPWPKVEPFVPKPKPKRVWISKADGTSKRAQTDKKFNEWLEKGNH